MQAMSKFDGKRLDKKVFQMDVKRLRKGWYSDKYFCNNVLLLETLAKENYTFQGESDIKDIDCTIVENGDLEVEMQIFTRRQPFSLVAGIDEALALLEECTGYYDEKGHFINTFDQLEIEALHDGTFVTYDGNPKNVKPILKIRGKYTHFAKLETPILGVVAVPTRIATNVFNTLVASQSKEILFFPARFDHYKTQALHGYSYSIAIQAYNEKYENKNCRFVSTDEQGAWWGGAGGGTIAHASICCFFGDTAETMMQFSRIMPVEVSRIALIDFHNDCVGDTLKVMKRMFEKYCEYYKAGNHAEAKKYKLFAVRPDTSGNMRDVSVVPIGDKSLDMGVNPRLIWNLRKAIDQAWLEWDCARGGTISQMAKEWCSEVKIVVTGGFTAAKINKFEELRVPVDIYGVGSSLLENSNETNNDFTADIVRVKLYDQKWHDMAKIGRCPCDNPDLVRLQ